MNSRDFFIKSAGRCAEHLSRNGLTGFLEIIGRSDPALGASGFSVMIADGICSAGKIDRARNLMEKNIVSTLNFGIKKKLKHMRTAKTPASVPHETRLQFMDKVLAAISPSGARPFLAFGTLLGLVREGGFMDHDSDLDLGVFTAEASCAEIGDLLIKKGLKILEYEGPEWPCRIKTAGPGNFRADIMFFKPEAGYLLTYIYFLNHIIIRRRTAFDLAEAEFCGRKVWIPENPENFLKENYGNWEKRSGYHHPVLMSRLTDFKLPVIRYLCARTFFRLLAKGEIDSASYLLDVITENYPDEPFWSGAGGHFRREYV